VKGKVKGEEKTKERERRGMKGKDNGKTKWKSLKEANLNFN
jgi:hypothetical protein